MKKRQHDYRIHQATQRAKLPVRHEPYWRSVGAGYLGYRKHSNPADSFWVARWTSGELQASGARRKTYQKRLGLEQDLSFEAAQAAALAWFEQCAGGVVRAGTVEEACRAYVDNMRIQKNERAAHFAHLRFALLVYGKPIGHTKLDELRDLDVTKWRNALVTDQRRKASANRDLRGFKAALNYAYRHKLVATDAAWRHVAPFTGADAATRARTAYLTPAQRRRLLDACDPDTANLLRGLLYTAARPLSESELPAARVADFDAEQGRLLLRNYKGKGDERLRYVTLNDEAVAFFKQMARSKLPGAYLFTRNGKPWTRLHWSEAIKKAVATVNADAKEPADRLPLDVCAYTMRHCAITDRLKSGVSISDVAKDAGTSIAMIEKHYAKYIVDDTLRAKLNQIVAF